MPTSRPSSPTTPPKPTATTTTTAHTAAQARYPQPAATAAAAHRRPPPPSYLSSLRRWLQLKKYQYEVTFSLYMLTPTERLIFNVIILLLLVLLVTAASMYLPNHVALIYNRIWYYVHGNGSDVGAGVGVDHTAAAVRIGARAGSGAAAGGVVQEGLHTLSGLGRGASPAAAERVLRSAVREL